MIDYHEADCPACEWDSPLGELVRRATGEQGYEW